MALPYSIGQSQQEELGQVNIRDSLGLDTEGKDVAWKWLLPKWPVWAIVLFSESVVH